jgi:hypothetical protein
MFLQLTFFVASVFFSIALTLLTIPVPLHLAEWELSTNSYLVRPNSDDLISHQVWLNMEKDKSEQQKKIFDYFGSFITRLKMESLRSQFNTDVEACFRGPSSKVIADINYFTDNTINNKLLKIKLNLTSLSRNDLEKCVKLTNEHYSDAFYSALKFNSSALNSQITALREDINLLKKIEVDYLNILHSKKANVIGTDDFNFILNLSKDLIKVLDLKSNKQERLNLLNFNEKYILQTKISPNLPKYSLTLDRNKIERFLVFSFSLFLFLNIVHLITKILNLKINISSKFCKVIISVFTRRWR